MHLGSDEFQVHVLALLGGLKRSVIEVGEQLVVFHLAEGVVFMVVTLGARHGQTQPDCGCGVYAIDHAIDSVHLRVSARFGIHG